MTHCACQIIILLNRPLLLIFIIILPSQLYLHEFALAKTLLTLLAWKRIHDHTQVALREVVAADEDLPE